MDSRYLCSTHLVPMKVVTIGNLKMHRCEVDGCTKVKPYKWGRKVQKKNVRLVS